MTPLEELVILIAEHARFPRYVYPTVEALIVIIREKSNDQQQQTQNDSK